MKLRKAAKNGLLDLDDPLATDSDEEEYESSDGGQLSDVIEGNEDIHAHDGDREVEAVVDDPANTNEGTSGKLEAFSSESSFDYEDDLETWSVHSDEDHGEWQQRQINHMRDVFFNQFTLFDVDQRCSYSAGEEDSDSDHLESPQPEANAAALTPDCDAAANFEDTHWNSVQSEAGCRLAQQRQRSQRMNPRRRRRRCAVSGASSGDDGGYCTSLSDLANSPGGTSRTPVSDPGLMRCRCRTTGCECVLRSDRAFCSIESEWEDSGPAGDVDDAVQYEMAECWLCLGEGRVVANHDSGRGSSGGTGCGGHGNDSDVNLEMVAPCRTCTGGLRTIHRSCFRTWLESSWAMACPNCRKLYDSAVLDDIIEGPSVRLMLLAACPPNHDLRQPFPTGALVYFVVGSVVQLCMGCGDLTAEELLRRIRLYVDDMAAVGGDGGLGLTDGGRPVLLPSFDVTDVVLSLSGASGTSNPWGSWPRTRSPPSGQADVREAEDLEIPNSEAADSLWHRGVAGGSHVREPNAEEYVDSDAEFDSEAESDSETARPPMASQIFTVSSGTHSSLRLRGRPPADRREDSFSIFMDSQRQDSDEHNIQLHSFTSPSAWLMSNMADNNFADVIRDRSDHAEAEPLWLRPMPPRDARLQQEPVEARSLVDRPALRAEQHRLRAELQLQQRNQQRRGGTSRGQQSRGRRR